jgi:hypothetical protein
MARLPVRGCMGVALRIGLLYVAFRVAYASVEVAFAHQLGYLITAFVLVLVHFYYVLIKKKTGFIGWRPGLMPSRSGSTPVHLEP